MSRFFPPVESATPEGIVAIGGALDTERLSDAYRNGIFPWPIEGIEETVWFCPPDRGVLFLSELKISKSLKTTLNHPSWEIRFNSDFESVIDECRRHHEERGGTWIRPEMRDAYLRLHQAGMAHSVECFRDSKLVGGLYGISMGGYFAGESMFHHMKDASKVAFVALVNHLREKKCEWLDVQVLNPFTASLGARAISREEFLRMLKLALKREITIFSSIESA